MSSEIRHSLSMLTPPASALLILMATASPLALNAFVPAMPDAARMLGVDAGVMQLTFTLYLLTLAFGQLMSGQLGDYFGRRPVILVGFGLHVLGSGIAAFAGTVEVLISGRILQALGGSAAMALARTILLDVYGRQGASGRMGYLVMAIALAQTLAPALGGVLNLWSGWHSVFYLSIAVGGAVWLIALWYLPETCAERSSSLSFFSVLRSYKGLLKSVAYRGYVLTTTALACGFYLFIGSAPYLVVESLGGTSADYGFWFLTVSLAFLLGSFMSTRLAHQIDLDGLIVIGNGLALLGALLLLFFYCEQGLSLPTLFLPMAIMILGRGLSQPVAQTAAISSGAGSTGAASGMMGFIQLLIGSMVAQSASWLIRFDPFWILAAILLTALLAMAAHFYSWSQSGSAK
ncbi:Bcr/CflA family efflux MFS transporter [Nitrincola tibetensis]|nr:Bcr/CflA family efflux MFS transporter [Nitrincola tibetensis]